MHWTCLWSTDVSIYIWNKYWLWFCSFDLFHKWHDGCYLFTCVNGYVLCSLLFYSTKLLVNTVHFFLCLSLIIFLWKLNTFTLFPAKLTNTCEASLDHVTKCQQIPPGLGTLRGHVCPWVLRPSPCLSFLCMHTTTDVSYCTQCAV